MSKIVIVVDDAKIVGLGGERPLSLSEILSSFLSLTSVAFSFLLLNLHQYFTFGTITSTCTPSSVRSFPYSPSTYFAPSYLSLAESSLPIRCLAGGGGK